jgi:hypothetical protein
MAKYPVLQDGGNLLLGIWFIASPWILGFTEINYAPENAYVLGVIIAVTAASMLPDFRGVAHTSIGANRAPDDRSIPANISSGLVWVHASKSGAAQKMSVVAP